MILKTEIVARLTIQLMKFNCKNYLFTIILLATCTLWGQISEDNSTTKSFIIAHKQNNNILFEFTEDLFNKEMLFVMHDIGYKQVFFHKVGNNIFLSELPIQSSSGVIIPINGDPSNKIITYGRFPILKHDLKSNRFAIDVTEFFSEMQIEWSSGYLENNNTKYFIDDIQYLNNEIVLSTSQSGIQTNQSSSFSLFFLPHPMKPRAFDYRMGFFIEDEMSAINHFRETKKGNISRWRLEKKQQSDSISDPIKPIVFYLDSTIPKKFISYVKAGILEWQLAFKEIGFTNAIQVKQVPLKGNAKLYTNSVNYSFVRWSNQTDVRGSENKSGSTVSKIVDFRSGEILKADILIKSSYQSLMDEYYIRCSPLDYRAQQYPFPDELLGELIQSVVAHETGHALGLRDGNYGEYAYSFNNIRDLNWLKRMGHTPSIMNYSRHNYLAQKEDNIPSSLLIQKVGPADLYSIKWGYQTEKQHNDNVLSDGIINLQDSIPWYQFSIGQYEMIGPQYSDEVADNDNPIKSAVLGLKNMRKVIELLPVTTKNEKDTELLERLYSKTLIFWNDQMLHVATLIGGYKVSNGLRNNKKYEFTPIPRSIQKESIKFLTDNVFYKPNWLSHPNFIQQINYSTTSDDLLKMQNELLIDLLSPLRLKRLEFMEGLIKFGGITNDLVTLLQHGIWNELYAESTIIDPYRQEIQCTYLELMDAALNNKRDYNVKALKNPHTEHNNFAKNVFRASLFTLRKDLVKQLAFTTDKVSYAHLLSSIIKIEQILSL